MSLRSLVDFGRRLHDTTFKITESSDSKTDSEDETSSGPNKDMSVGHSPYFGYPTSWYNPFTSQMCDPLDICFGCGQDIVCLCTKRTKTDLSQTTNFIGTEHEQSLPLCWHCRCLNPLCRRCKCKMYSSFCAQHTTHVSNASKLSCVEESENKYHKTCSRCQKSIFLSCHCLQQNTDSLFGGQIYSNISNTSYLGFLEMRQVSSFHPDHLIWWLYMIYGIVHKLTITSWLWTWWKFHHQLYFIGPWGTTIKQRGILVDNWCKC